MTNPIEDNSRDKTSSRRIKIVVGVALDTMGQLENHLIMRHYEGFLKKGRMKQRWFNVGA